MTGAASIPNRFKWQRKRLYLSDMPRPFAAPGPTAFVWFFQKFSAAAAPIWKARTARLPAEPLSPHMQISAPSTCCCCCGESPSGMISALYLHPPPPTTHPRPRGPVRSNDAS
jgi:hypothetical protein